MENKENIIVELSTTTGYSPEIIEILYDFTNGDKDGIKKILSSLRRNILVVKANFESPTLDKSGFFYFAYDTGKYEILEKGFFAYRKYDKIDLKKSWDELRKDIFEMKAAGDFDGRMWSFFEREFARQGFVKELKRITADFIESPKYGRILETLLGKALAPVFYNKNYSMELETDMLDPLLFYKPLEKMETEEEWEEEAPPSEEEKENVIVTLKVYPVLDPIKGKPANEIMSDEKVLFELRDERESAAYISELLKEKSPAGLVGNIQSITSMDADTYKLNIHFAPGIQGESIVPKTVMLKVTDYTDYRVEGEFGEEKFIKLSYKSFITGIIIVMFIIIFFLFLYR